MRVWERCWAAAGWAVAMEPVAVIDVGSNSVCLLVAARLRDGTLATLDKRKDTARLRDEVGEDGCLTERGMERAVNVFCLFAEVLRNWSVRRVRVVGTAALRAAINANDLVERIERSSGLQLEIISGEEEARLAFLGVLYGMGRRATGRVLCADVGGGSTEVILAEGGEVLKATSIPVGALVVTRQWLGADPVEPEAVAHARHQLRETFAHLRDSRDWPSVDLAIATSGTIQRVARIACAQDGQNIQDVHGLTLPHPQLAQVTGALEAARTNENRLRLPGMDPVRADILLGGALIYEILAETLNLQGWTVSMDGLRMGVLGELATGPW